MFKLDARTVARWPRAVMAAEGKTRYLVLGKTKQRRHRIVGIRHPFGSACLFRTCSVASFHRSPRLSDCYLAQRELCVPYNHSLISQNLGFTIQDVAVDDGERCVHVTNSVFLMTNHTAGVAAMAQMGLWVRVSSTTS